MPLVSASKEICNLIYIMVQVIIHFHPSSDSVVVRVMDSHTAVPDSIPSSDNGTLSKIVTSIDMYQYLNIKLQSFQEFH